MLAAPGGKGKKWRGKGRAGSGRDQHGKSIDFWAKAMGVFRGCGDL